MGILHPGTSFGVFWSTNVAWNWYRNEKYPLIPEKPGIRRGIPREGDDILGQERCAPSRNYIKLSCVAQLPSISVTPHHELGPPTNASLREVHVLAERWSANTRIHGAMAHTP